jgi:hypothetical protein
MVMSDSVCWLITVSEWVSPNNWESYLDSIHLGESDALSRIQTVVNENGGAGNPEWLETINAYRGRPNSWRWWNPDRNFIVCAERVEVGKPFLRFMRAPDGSIMREELKVWTETDVVVTEAGD